MTSFSYWWLQMYSELIGTALLILLGNGVCAAVSYKRMNANQSGKWILVALGWGLAVFVATMVSTSMNGNGLLNPAVLVMQTMMASKDTNLINLPMFNNGVIVTQSVFGGIAATFFIILIFQFLGAILGQTILNFINFKFINDKENNLLTIRGAHCTTSSYKNKEDKATIFNFAYEFVGTLILVGMILVLFKKTNIDSNTMSIFSMLVVTSIGISLGSATGFALNPARDLSPRIVFYLFVNFFRKDEKNNSIFEWDYSWILVAAPLSAGIIMGCFGLI